MIVQPDTKSGGFTAFQRMHGRPFVAEGETSRKAVYELVRSMADHCAKTGQKIHIERPVFDEPRVARGRV